MKIFSIRLVAFVFVLGLGIVQPGFCLDSTGFNPATVSVQSVGSSIPVGTVITWPSSSWPPDADNWLECNGQAINSTVYPELAGVIGSRVPDYRGRFLRGLQAGHSVGQTVANSIKSHNHTQPTHTHSFSGQLVSTALSGTAAGQRYSDDAVLWTTNYYNAADVINGSGPIRSSNIRSNISTKTANSSSVTGNLKSGTVSGSIGAGGGNPTDYTGSEETAPDHIYVRCLIRAKP